MVWTFSLSRSTAKHFVLNLIFFFSSRFLLKLSRNKTITIGIFFAILAAMLEALVDVFPKPLMNIPGQTGIEPLVMAFVIYAVNGIIFTPFSRKKKTKLEVKTVVLLVIIGIVEAASTIFFLYGLRQTTAVNATILLNSEIVFGIIIAMLFLNERLRRNETLPFGLICSGAIILPLISDMRTATLDSSFMMGNAFVLIAGTLLGAGSCLYKYLSDNVALSQIMQYASFVGAIMSMILIIILKIPLKFDVSQLPNVLFIGIFGIGLSAFCYIFALKHIGAVKTIIVFSSTTVFGVVLSNLVLSESILPGNVASVLLIITGTVILRNKMA